MTDKLPSVGDFGDFFIKYFEYLDGKRNYEDLPVLGSLSQARTYIQQAEDSMMAAMERQGRSLHVNVPPEQRAAPTLPLPALSEENKKKAEEAEIKYKEFVRPTVSPYDFVSVIVKQSSHADGLDDFLRASDDLMSFGERSIILDLARTLEWMEGQNYRSDYLPYLTTLAQKAIPLIKMIIKLEEYNQELRDTLYRVYNERFGR